MANQIAPQPSLIQLLTEHFPSDVAALTAVFVDSNHIEPLLREIYTSCQNPAPDRQIRVSEERLVNVLASSSSFWTLEQLELLEATHSLVMSRLGKTARFDGSKIRALELSASNIDDTQLCNSIQKYPHLERLRVAEDLHSWPKKLTQFKAITALTHLIELDIRGCHITNSDLSALCGLPQLRRLHLKQCDMLTDISPIRSLSNLTHLTLSSLKHFAHSNHDFSHFFSPLSNLTYLDISGINFINYKPLQPGTFPHLAHLNLSSGCLRDEGLPPLVDAAPNLVSLNLAYNGESVQDIGPLSRLRALTSLDLEEFHLINEDIRGLATDLPNLTHLSLRECTGITDFAPLSQLPLRSLNLYGCKIPQTQLQRLHETLPHMETYSSHGVSPHS